MENHVRRGIAVVHTNPWGFIAYNAIVKGYLSFMGHHSNICFDCNASFGLSTTKNKPPNYFRNNIGVQIIGVLLAFKVRDYFFMILLSDLNNLEIVRPQAYLENKIKIN